MQKPQPCPTAATLADQMIYERFFDRHGLATWSDYCKEVDTRTTAHLSEHLAARCMKTAGVQRRRMVFHLEGAEVTASIPMNDSRAGEEVWAQMEFSTYLNAVECGADTALYMQHKGRNTIGQVCFDPAFRRASGIPPTALARVIVNAKPGQSARNLDRNPLNLRKGNIYLDGRPKSTEGNRKSPKTDTRAIVRELAQRRASLAGKEYGIEGREA